VFRSAVAGWSIAWAALASPVRAEPFESRAPAGARTILITLVGTEAALDDFSSLVLEWFGDDRAQVELRRLDRLEPSDVLDSKSPGSTLRVWVMPSSRELVRVYLADGSGERFLVRDVVVRNGLDELGRESLAQVLVTSGKAFLSHHASSTRDEVRRTFAPESGSNPPVTPAPSAAPPAVLPAPGGGAGRRDHPPLA
jgi:hypothetical protein